MEKITIDEQNKRRIQKYLKQLVGIYGYENDIALLEEKGQLTEELAIKVFSEIMNDAYRTRTMLEPKENSEFKEQIEETFLKYDKIPKPEQFEQYGFYDGAYNNMELDEIFSNMQIAFELRELGNKYYECRDLRNIANTVINSIDGIEKYKINVPSEAKEELQKVQEELRMLLSAEKTDIKGIQERIELYNEHATNIWIDYLTSVDDVENGQYRWVIHNLTKGELEGDFRNKYMSTSLMTNNEMGRYGSANYGLIIKPKHIVCASYKDTYTLNTRDDEENLFNIKPPLMLPQEIEDLCIKQTIEKNGEMLNYEKAPIYSEIVVDEYDIEGAYYVSYGEHELANDYERAKKVADERGLPLIERDISKYRAEHGFEPMTEKSKRDLCRNVLWKCCAGNKELEQIYSQFSKEFIDNHFQEFYEQFMKTKENPEYSKEDILRTFADVARRDMIFGKISQNIDEMYQSEEQKETVPDFKEDGLTEFDEKTMAEKQETQEVVDNSGARINEFGEIIRENKIQKNNMWENRFKSWYGAIDKVSQNSKSKFLKMKADILKAITNKIKERTNIDKIHKDTNER